MGLIWLDLLQLAIIWLFYFLNLVSWPHLVIVPLLMLTIAVASAAPDVNGKAGRRLRCFSSNLCQHPRKLFRRGHLEEELAIDMDQVLHYLTNCTTWRTVSFHSQSFPIFVRALGIRSLQRAARGLDVWCECGRTNKPGISAERTLVDERAAPGAAAEPSWSKSVISSGLTSTISMRRKSRTELWLIKTIENPILTCTGVL